MAKFGPRVAEKTFHKVRSFVFQSLSTYPHIGVHRRKHDVYEAVIPRTPFVVFYRIDATADTLTVVALFHHAQDRRSEWGGE